MTDIIIDSTGNVFTDLGFEAEAATILQTRAKLMPDLRDQIESNG